MLALLSCKVDNVLFNLFISFCLFVCFCFLVVVFSGGGGCLFLIKVITGSKVKLEEKTNKK